MAKKTGKSLVVLMALGTFVVVLDNTVMNVSISALVEDLNTTVTGVQAAISLNALMMAAFVLMGGKLADIMGMKKTFLTGAVFYILGSSLASISSNLYTFILGWCAIQGFGAALMLPNVNTIVQTYTTGKAKAEAFGTLIGINAVGTAVGPIIGGFFTTYITWRLAFWLEIAILIGVLLFSGIIPKDAKIKDKLKLDVVGVFLQAAAMILLVVGSLLITDYGLLLAKQPFVIAGHEIAPFGLSIVPILWGLGILFLLLFARWETKLSRTGKDPLIDLSLFKNSGFVKGLNVRFIHVSLIAAMVFVVPLYLQVTWGLTAFETGFVLLAFSLGLLLMSSIGSKKRLQILPKNKITNGFVVGIIGTLMMLAYLYLGDSARGLTPGLFVFGLGMGLVGSQIVNLVLSSVKDKESAEASAINSTMETLGNSIGVAIIGTILIVSLTNGTTRLIDKSEVLPEDVKADVDAQIQSSIEVVSDEVIAQEITEDGAIEAEIIDIYDTARQNAFAITMLSVAFVSLLGFIFSRSLPAKKLVASN